MAMTSSPLNQPIWHLVGIQATVRYFSMLYMCDNYTKESEYDNTQVKIISIPSFYSNNKKYGETYKHTKKITTLIKFCLDVRN